MAKFRAGLLAGLLCGTVYGLLTAKKTGAQRQQGIVDYVNGVTQATGDVQHAVKRFGAATQSLRTQLHDTLQPALTDINASVADFEFQTEPHIEALNDHLTNITTATEKLSDDAPSSDGE